MEVKRLLNNDEDFQEIMRWAQRATAPPNKVKDAIKRRDPGEWNILRLLPYKYSKKVCVAFFRDPRFHMLFELFFERILAMGPDICPNRKHNRKPADPALPKRPNM